MGYYEVGPMRTAQRDGTAEDADSEPPSASATFDMDLLRC